MNKQQIKSKYSTQIADWWEPSGEEFKYDIMVNEPYSFSDWALNEQCQHTETFETLSQVSHALKHLFVVSREVHCAKCRFWNGSKCIK